MKQITITVPNNCELKQNGNTYTIVEKEKKLTYESVAIELFSNKQGWYIEANGDICFINRHPKYERFLSANSFISHKQAEKLLAINKLMIVAKYLNGDWKPDWCVYNQYKYYICYVHNYLRIEVEFNTVEQGNSIYFKSKELAKQAIEILGEETIKLALSTDY